MRLSTRKNKLTVHDITVFALLGAIMCFSRFITQLLPPNVHFLGLFIAAFTLTYRMRALIPLYVFVLLNGVFWGFDMNFVGYLYAWLPLWGMFMIAGRFKLRNEIKIPLYMVLCALHGLSFGVLMAPVNAVLFGFSFEAMLIWIIGGLTFDTFHAAGNFAAGTLIVPLVSLLKQIDKGVTSQ
jgi:energy-coupling factor transport system substrate-specific component